MQLDAVRGYYHENPLPIQWEDVSPHPTEFGRSKLMINLHYPPPIECGGHLLGACFFVDPTHGEPGPLAQDMHNGF